jgi:hypothetical protein
MPIAFGLTSRKLFMSSEGLCPVHRIVQKELNVHSGIGKKPW